MRVLLTNNTLGEPAGTELYVHDVAVELLRRGHHPIAFSTMLGEVARQLNAVTVPVVDNLDRLGEPPDIIHAQHHYETLTASLYFPDVPLVNVCHGWGPPQEQPFLSPRVAKYIAVSDACRDRLIDQFGIPPSRVEVLLNFVDLTRFRPRSRLPARPARALAFGNYFVVNERLSAIQDACTEAGITLDVLGSGSGHTVSKPEEILPLYDIVFATGRAALEAAAVGTAVMPAGSRGFGPLVNTQNWHALRRQNFGLRALWLPFCKETVAEQLAHYDPEDASRVCEMAQSQAGLVDACSRLLQVYDKVRSGWSSAQMGHGEAQRAAARHLTHYAATFKSYSSGYTTEWQSPEQRTLEVFGKLLMGKAPRAVEANGPLQGYVESAARSSGMVKVIGWAASRLKEAVTALLVMQNGHCAAAGCMEIPRPDVAAYLGNQETAFGFDMQFQAGDGPLLILVLMESGELFDISELSAPATLKVLNGISRP